MLRAGAVGQIGEVICSSDNEAVKQGLRALAALAPEKTAQTQLAADHLIGRCGGPAHTISVYCRNPAHRPP